MNDSKHKEADQLMQQGNTSTWADKSQLSSASTCYSCSSSSSVHNDIITKQQLYKEDFHNNVGDDSVRLHATEAARSGCEPVTRQARHR